MCVVVVVKKDRKKELHWGSSSEGLNALLVVRCADCSYILEKRNERTCFLRRLWRIERQVKSEPQSWRWGQCTTTASKKGQKIVSLYKYIYVLLKQQQQQESIVISAVIPLLVAYSDFWWSPSYPKGGLSK